MYRATRLKITELNPHLVCVLCGGYLIDATTIVECLHSFCKTCIVRYLESSKFCPICDVQVHKTKPLLNIRLDHTLQDIVYKLVPGLFKEEMMKRREFYKEQAKNDDVDFSSAVNSSGAYIDDDGEIQRERVIFSADEKISLALQLSIDGRPPRRHSKKKKDDDPNQDCRYLLCPAGVTIGHLKKFIRMKFNLCDRYQIDVFHTDEALSDKFSLMDVAYIYLWRRKGPMRLYYTVYNNPAKRFKRTSSCTVTCETENTTCSGHVGENQASDKTTTEMDIQHTSDNVTGKLKTNHIETVSVTTATAAATAASPLSSRTLSSSSSSSSSPPFVEKKQCVATKSPEKTTEKPKEMNNTERTKNETVILTPPGPRINGINLPFSLMNGHHNVPHINNNGIAHSPNNHSDSTEVAQDLSMKKKTPTPPLAVPPPIPKENGEKTDKSVPPKPNGLLPNGEVDKFAFTDDDDILPLSSHKLTHVHVKSEPVTIE